VSICDNIMFLKVLRFIRILLDLVCFLVPIGLIVMVSLDLGKNVIAGKEDEMRKNVNLVIKRLIYAIGLFLVPVIVDVAINWVGMFNVDYEACFNVTDQEIENKIAEAKAKCVGDNRWWSDITFKCEENEVYDDPVYENDNVKYKVSSSSNSSASNSNASSSSSNSSSSSSSSSSGGAKMLIYYNQGSYYNVKFCSGTKNLQSSGCGAVSLAMMASTFSNKKYTPEVMAKWLCSNGHGGGALGTSFFTKESLLNHFNLKVETLFKVSSSLNRGNAGDKYDSSKGTKILNAVKSGKGVILYIPGHYLAVGPNPSCKSTEVYLYDVGKRDNNGCYTMKELFNKTYNYKSRCSSGGNCGWKFAYAYSKK